MYFKGDFYKWESFYVIKFKNGQYFREFTATGRVAFLNNFEEAAKLFDCSFKNESEVHEMADKIDAQVLSYTYSMDEPEEIQKSINVSTMQLGQRNELLVNELDVIKADLVDRVENFNK